MTRRQAWPTSPIHIRGNHLKLGDVVAAARAAGVSRSRRSRIPADQSGRLELAHWLTPTRASAHRRVMVNRVWRWHFGKGLVRTTDNFGLLGERPTHPELLDWLAASVRASGGVGQGDCTG